MEYLHMIRLVVVFLLLLVYVALVQSINRIVAKNEPSHPAHYPATPIELAAAEVIRIVFILVLWHVARA